MTTILAWQLKEHLWRFREEPGDGKELRYEVLTILMLYANARNRSWPSQGTIAQCVSGTDSNGAVDRVRHALEWLEEHGAIYAVPSKFQVAEERSRRHPRMKVWQLTGAIRFGDVVVPYLYMTEEAWKEAEFLLTLDGQKARQYLFGDVNLAEIYGVWTRENRAFVHPPETGDCDQHPVSGCCNPPVTRVYNPPVTRDKYSQVEDGSREDSQEKTCEPEKPGSRPLTPSASRTKLPYDLTLPKTLNGTTRKISEGEGDEPEPPSLFEQFLIDQSGVNARRMTARQAALLSEPVEFFIDGKAMSAVPQDLFDEDPYYKRWIVEKVVPVLKSRGKKTPKGRIISRDTIVKAVTTAGGEQSFSLPAFFEWRATQVSVESISQIESCQVPNL